LDAGCGELERGYAPPRNARAGEWLVPIPATYLVSPKGTILLGAVYVDYRKRIHSAQLVTALNGMRRLGKPDMCPTPFGD
jgi:hypothetical protein